MVGSLEVMPVSAQQGTGLFFPLRFVHLPTPTRHTLSSRFKVTEGKTLDAHHEAVEGVHLTHQGALCQAANAGVAAHLPDTGGRRGRDQQGTGASPGSSRSRLAACM